MRAVLPGFIISTTLLVSSLIHPDVPPSCLLRLYTADGGNGQHVPSVRREGSDTGQEHPRRRIYSVGDVICFHSGDVYVMHRISEITADDSEDTVYITKGDANNTPDQGSVSQSQILGIYKTCFEGWGSALMFIQTPVGMLVCVMLPLVIVLLLFLVPPCIEARKKLNSQDEESREENQIR